MKRIKKIIPVLLVPLVIALLLALIPHTKNLSFADTIIITKLCGEGESITVEINKEQNSAEFKKIMQYCNKSAFADPFSIPACMFEGFRLEFKNDFISVEVYPCNDGCATMLMKSAGREIYYTIETNEKTELDTLLNALIL